MASGGLYTPSHQEALDRALHRIYGNTPSNGFMPSSSGTKTAGVNRPGWDRTTSGPPSGARSRPMSAPRPRSSAQRPPREPWGSGLSPRAKGNPSGIKAAAEARRSPSPPRRGAYGHARPVDDDEMEERAYARVRLRQEARRVHDLEEVLQAKDDEISKLKSKVSKVASQRSALALTLERRGGEEGGGEPPRDPRLLQLARRYKECEAQLAAAEDKAEAERKRAEALVAGAAESATRAEAAQGDKERLEKLRAGLEKRAANAERRRKEAEESQQKAAMAMADLSARVEALHKQVASMQEEKNGLLTGKVRADRRAEGLQAKLNEVLKRMEGEARDHARAAENYEALQERMEVIRRKNAALEAAAEVAREEREAMEAELAVREEECQLLAGIVQAQQAQHAQEGGGMVTPYGLATGGRPHGE